MHIDLRFVDAGYELMILAEYLKLIEADTSEIVERGKERIRRSRHDTDDEVDQSIASHLEYRLEDGIMTRFLTASVVMASWAIYEATVEEVAEYLQAKKQITVSMSDLRGGLLRRGRKYFKDFLNFELHPSTTNWGRLEHLGELRNVLAHSNGYLRNVPKSKRTNLDLWLASTPGLTIADQHYILVSLTFASESLQFIDELVTDLVERVRRTFPLR